MGHAGVSASKVRAYLIQILSAVIGGSAMVAFTVFLFTGPWRVVVLFTDLQSILAFDLLLSAVFFIQHSGMVRTSFKTWFGRRLPVEYHGAVFSIVSGLCLFAIVHLWQASEAILLSADGLPRYALRLVFLAAIASIIWSYLALHSFDSFGLRAIRYHLQGKSQPVMRFTESGPYRWVRHPQYSCALVMIWTHPDLTADRLLFNLVWSSWVVLGIWLEERDLVMTFGQQYRAYQSRVPMLIPVRL